MAKSAPVKYEVRWREAGTLQWGNVSNIDPSDEIVVEGLDRTKTYEFQVRAVASCGARSAWVSSSQALPDVPAGTLRLDDLKAEVDDAAADALAANQELANIASDNVLSQGEKPVVIRDTNVITTEQAGIDAQATAYGITTEKTAYDGAVTALTTYLATLTTPTLWSDLSGDTTIVGTTFRSKFADVYTTRQALLNAIYAAAKAKADAAQSSADTATGQVSQLPVINGGFDMTPTGYGWNADAGSGWTIDTAGNTPGVGPNSAKHTGGAGTGAYRNGGLAACLPGQVYKSQGLVKAVGANGSCYVYISWCDASGAEIDTTPGNVITGTTTAGSFAVGTAPAGTVYARTCIGVTGHTAGTYYVDNVLCTQHPSSVDEVPDGTTHTRQIAKSTSETVDNANFELPQGADGSIPGWVPTGGATLGLTGPGSYATYSGAHSLGVGGTSQYCGVECTRKYACTAGEQYLLQAAIYSETGSPASLQLRYYAADGSYVGDTTDGSGGYGAWLPRSVSGTVPSGASYLTILAYNAGAGGGQFYMDAVRLSRVRSIDTELADGTTYARIKGTELSSGIHRLGIAGSGARLGDLRNQVMVGVGNYASGWNGGTLSYSATTTSATISASAATLQIGSNSLAYSASSTTVSGSAGTTVTYYLYYDDPSYTAGSKTLNATTSQITALASDGRVFVGKLAVTFPTSGTGTGSGGTGCPDENSWVLRADPEGMRSDWCVRAKEIKEGHYLRLTDGRIGLVTYSERKAAPRVRVFDENEATLTCSHSAPLELAGAAGGCVPAPEATGRKIKALVECVQFDPIIWKVEDAGPGYVQHITCQNACFWTGDDPDYLFGHHNMKPG